MLSWSHLRGAAKGVRIAARSSNPEGLARGSYPISAPARRSLCYSAGVWQSPWTVSCEWSVSRDGEQWSALAAVPASNEKGLWQVSFWELVDACYFVYVPLSFSLFPKQWCSAKPFMICEQGSRALWTLNLFFSGWKLEHKILFINEIELPLLLSLSLAGRVHLFLP